MTDLQDLHRALSEAESGSRELDADIEFLVSEGVFNTPRYTTDLNAITSLVERKLPGWRIASNSDYDRSPLWCAAVKQRGESWDGRWQCAPTEPLARAIALVSALIAQESEK